MKRINVVLLFFIFLSISFYLVNNFYVGIPRPQYFKFANLILTSTSWWHELDFTNCFCGDGMSDVTTYRSIGYPIVIALCKFLFGKFYLKAILYFQVLVFAYSAHQLYTLGKAVRLNNFFSLLLLCSYLTGWGATMQYDFVADALFTSLFTIVLVMCSKIIINNQLEHKKQLFKVGLMFLLLFLIKEVMLQLSFLFVSLFFLYFSKKEMFSHKNMLIIFKSVTILFFPLFVLAMFQSTWNAYRSGGHFFVNLAPRTALLVPIEHAIIDNNDIMKNSILYDAEAQENIRKQIKEKKLTSLKIGYFFLEIPNRDVQRRMGWTEYQLNEKTKQEYYRIWKQYPKTMIKIVVLHMLSNVDLLFIIRPIESFIDYCHGLDRYKIFSQDKEHKLRLFPRLSVFIKTTNKYGLREVLFILIVNLFRLFSVGIYGLFVFSIIKNIFNIYNNKCDNINFSRVELFLFLIYSGYITVYSCVHVETRYLAAVFSLPLVFGLKQTQLLSKKYCNIENLIKFKLKGFISNEA